MLGKRLITLFMACILSSVSVVVYSQAEESSNMKVAFIRNGNLWIKQNGLESQITYDGNSFLPKWSSDGNYVLYQTKGLSKLPNKNTQSEIWAYHVKTKEKTQVFYDGYSPKWSPNQNIISFKNDSILDVSNLQRFYNIALGVDDYAWFPKGSGFLAGSSANLRPDGWTNPEIFKVPLEKNIEKTTPKPNKVKKIYTLPKKIKKGNKSIISINVGTFNFSPIGHWISFIVSPTASWSMDSNMLCALSLDKKQLQVIDEVILYGIGQPKWAPSSNILGYIAGGGRIITGYKNKELKVKKFPSLESTNLTPKNYGDIDFTWIDNQNMVVSRVYLDEEINKDNKVPLPSLYLINIETKKQQKITTPENGWGDYGPKYIKSLHQIVWQRIHTEKGIGGIGDIWISNINGTNPKKWIDHVSEYSIFE